MNNNEDASTPGEVAGAESAGEWVESETPGAGSVAQPLSGCPSSPPRPNVFPEAPAVAFLLFSGAAAILPGMDWETAPRSVQ